MSLEYSMVVKLLTEQHLEFLSLKGGCGGSSESTLVKMPHCWKSHALAHIRFRQISVYICIRLGCIRLDLLTIIYSDSKSGHYSEVNKPNWCNPLIFNSPVFAVCPA